MNICISLGYGINIGDFHDDQRDPMEPTLLEKEQVHLSRLVHISCDELWSMYGMVTCCQGNPDLQHLSSFNQCFSTTTTGLLLLDDMSVSSSMLSYLLMPVFCLRFRAISPRPAPNFTKTIF
jgi:hypothetical protein